MAKLAKLVVFLPGPDTSDAWKVVCETSSTCAALDPIHKPETLGWGLTAAFSARWDTVDGSEIPRQTTWDDTKTLVNTGRFQLPFPQLVSWSPDFERTIKSMMRDLRSVAWGWEYFALSPFLFSQPVVWMLLVSCSKAFRRCTEDHRFWWHSKLLPQERFSGVRRSRCWMPFSWIDLWFLRLNLAQSFSNLSSTWYP